jgi:phenylacetate-CoA ligase
MSLPTPFSGLSGCVFPALPPTANALQLSIQFQLEHTQWWTDERLRAEQLRQLSLVVQHAFATSPFYRDHYAALGAPPPRDLTEEDWSRLPIVSRAKLQEADASWASTRPPKEHGPVSFSTTSGSTGRAIRFARTSATSSFWQAFALRDHLWQKRDLSAKLSAIRWLPRGEAVAPAGRTAATWGPPIAGLFPGGPFSILNVVATLPEQLTWLKKEKPDYLASFPSNLKALAEYAKSRGESLPAVRSLRTIGETVSPETRRFLTEAWSAPLADIYTCEEAGYLALQCPGQDHYHVQSENVRIEIVDEAGNPCPPGQSGRVLVSSLNNFATPLIRYEIGDYAEFGEPCSCGRGLPVLRRIHGRRRNRLHLPSGETVFPYLGEHGQILQLTGVKVREFQCVQHDLRRVEVKLVADRVFTAEEESKVAAKMRENLGHPFEVFYTFHQSIERGPRGKFEEFVSLVELPPTAEAAP